MTLLYTGAYTKPPMGRAQGIGVHRYDTETGTLALVSTATGITNPSFLTLSDDGRHLYAVCESEGGAVTAYARDPKTGELTELNRQASGGNGPCYVSMDASGRYALVANYGSGSIAALPIAADGSLEAASSVVQHEGSSANPDRQEGPHAHMIIPTPDGRFVLAVDLGTDEVITYALDTETGQLERRSALTTPPGAGPRHVAFSPDGATVYVITELGNTIIACDYNVDTGALTARQTVPTLPADFDGESFCAHIVVSDDGRFVYGSNRGHDSIVVVAVDESSGEMRVIGHTSTEGEFPRNFTLDPTGTRLLVANQNTDNVTVMSRDAESGQLTRETVLTGIPSTVCLVFAPEA